MDAFPKIFHIGEGYIPHLLDGPVEVTEKVDGSQFGFGWDRKGAFACRSKRQDITHQDRGMFDLAKKQAIISMAGLDMSGIQETRIYFYCEYLNKPKHNVLKYDRVPLHYLYLFGVNYGGSWITNPNELTYWAKILDIEPPNVLFSGEVANIEQLKSLLDSPSILGGTTVEGIVIKNYNEPVIAGHYTLPLSMGKWVREDFKERHSKEFKTDKDELTAFIDTFHTEARWRKAVQHFRDDGKLEGAPRDIGPLMGEIARDLLEEETEFIKDALFKMFKRRIAQRAQGGFPEWFKEQLANGTLIS